MTTKKYRKHLTYDDEHDYSDDDYSTCLIENDSFRGLERLENVQVFYTVLYITCSFWVCFVSKPPNRHTQAYTINISAI